MPDSPEKLSDIQSKVAGLTANIGDVKEGLGRIAASVESGNRQNIEILTKLAVIQSKQTDAASYQDRCDSDRDQLKTRLSDVERVAQAAKKGVDTNDGRLTKIESTFAGVRGAWYVLAALAGLAGLFLGGAFQLIAAKIH